MPFLAIASSYMNTSPNSHGASTPAARSLVVAGLVFVFAWLVFKEPAQADNAPAAPAVAKAGPGINYRHKQVAMPIQPTLGKLDRPFVPEFEEEFKGWEVVNCITLPSSPWPLDVKVPTDRRYRPVPNQKITWMLYTLRQPAP